jgi:hypothetical protein
LLFDFAFAEAETRPQFPLWHHNLDGILAHRRRPVVSIVEIPRHLSRSKGHREKRGPGRRAVNLEKALEKKRGGFYPAPQLSG